MLCWTKLWLFLVCSTCQWSSLRDHTLLICMIHKITILMYIIHSFYVYLLTTDQLVCGVRKNSTLSKNPLLESWVDKGLLSVSYPHLHVIAQIRQAISLSIHGQTNGFLHCLAMTSKPQIGNTFGSAMAQCWHHKFHQVPSTIVNIIPIPTTHNQHLEIFSKQRTIFKDQLAANSFLGGLDSGSFVHLGIQTDIFLHTLSFACHGQQRPRADPHSRRSAYLKTKNFLLFGNG